MSYSEKRWVVGYGKRGVTGPTTPSMAPTVKEAVERAEYNKAYNDWVEKGALPSDKPESPETKHVIISLDMETIAIIPTSGEQDGKANAQRIVDCVSACQGLTKEEIVELVERYKEGRINFQGTFEKIPDTHHLTKEKAVDEPPKEPEPTMREVQISGRYQVQLVWNREFNWVNRCEPFVVLKDAITEAEILENLGDGESVKKTQIVDIETGKVVWAYGRKVK